jgi:hypothetical protein
MSELEPPQVASIDWTGIGTFLVGLAAVATLLWTIYQQRRINATDSRLKSLEEQPAPKHRKRAQEAK